MVKVTWLFTLFLGVSMLGNAQPKVSVAVAANFKPTLALLAQAYKQDHPLGNVVISSASSGVIFAQIQRGAPFDIFLSADSVRPKLLEQQGLTLKGSRQTYARGRLVLWTPSEPHTTKDVLRALEGKLAIANPQLAPFGLAAKVALQRLAYWQQVQQHLVMANNVQQVSQLIASGAAQMGFVALSQVLNVPEGQYWLLPADYYPPITQQMVILARQPADPPGHRLAVRAFYDFILANQGQKIISKNGYLSAPMQTLPKDSLDVR